MDMPETAIKAQLAAVIKVRALLELATVNSWSCTYRILNKDEKTVVRLVYTERVLDTDGEGSAPRTFITVRPLRGYNKQSNQLVACLQRSLDIAPTNESIHFWAAQAASQTPGEYLENRTNWTRTCGPARPPG